MKKIILLILSLVVMISVYNNAKETENIIPDEAIRFRIVANSNSIYDQNIKLQLRNVIQNKIFEIIKDSKDINETRKLIVENENELKNLTEETLKKLNYDKNYKFKYGYNHFPKKKYKGITYKEGDYESLVITLGEGDGDNFWCVLFPPLCLLEAEDGTNDAEYTFFVKELVNKYFKK